jgi:hypothetical protein
MLHVSAFVGNVSPRLVFTDKMVTTVPVSVWETKFHTHKGGGGGYLTHFWLLKKYYSAYS